MKPTEKTINQILLEHGTHGVCEYQRELLRETNRRYYIAMGVLLICSVAGCVVAASVDAIAKFFHFLF